MGATHQGSIMPPPTVLSHRFLLKEERGGAVPLSEVGGGLGGTESKTGWHPNFCAP